MLPRMSTESIKPRVVYRWKRNPIVVPVRRGWQLSATEIENLKKVLRKLRHWYGADGLADVLGFKPSAIRHSTAKWRRPNAGLALAVAKLLGTPVETILTGEWPRAGTCPMCGRR